MTGLRYLLTPDVQLCRGPTSGLSLSRPRCNHKSFTIDMVRSSGWCFKVPRVGKISDWGVGGHLICGFDSIPRVMLVFEIDRG